jgi:cystathionine beta-synthase
VVRDRIRKFIRASPEKNDLFVRRLLDLIDGVKVTDAEAFETCRYLARRYGILVGGSACGVIYKALQQAQTGPPEATTVVLVCDGGERCLDTVYNDDWMATTGLYDAQVVNQLASMLR